MYKVQKKKKKQFHTTESTASQDWVNTNLTVRFHKRGENFVTRQLPDIKVSAPCS